MEYSIPYLKHIEYNFHILPYYSSILIFAHILNSRAWDVPHLLCLILYLVIRVEVVTLL